MKVSGGDCFPFRYIGTAVILDPFPPRSYRIIASIYSSIAVIRNGDADIYSGTAVILNQFSSRVRFLPRVWSHTSTMCSLTVLQLSRPSPPQNIDGMTSLVRHYGREGPKGASQTAHACVAVSPDIKILSLSGRVRLPARWSNGEDRYYFCASTSA